VLRPRRVPGVAAELMAGAAALAAHPRPHPPAEQRKKTPAQTAGAGVVSISPGHRHPGGGAPWKTHFFRQTPPGAGPPPLPPPDQAAADCPAARLIGAGAAIRAAPKELASHPSNASTHAGPGKQRRFASEKR